MGRACLVIWPSRRASVVLFERREQDPYHYLIEPARASLLIIHPLRGFGPPDPR